MYVVIIGDYVACVEKITPPLVDEVKKGSAIIVSNKFKMNADQTWSEIQPLEIQTEDPHLVS